MLSLFYSFSGGPWTILNSIGSVLLFGLLVVTIAICIYCLRRKKSSENYSISFRVNVTNRDISKTSKIKTVDAENMPVKVGITIQSVVIGDYVFVGGGGVNFDAVEEGYTWNCKVMKYDHKKKKWTESLPKYDYQYFAMTSFNDQLVLVGGCDRQNIRSDRIALFEFVSKKWITDRYNPMNTARDSATAVCVNNHIVVVGGCTTKKVRTSSVEVLDMSSVPGQWLTTESLPIPRSSMKSTVDEDKNALYLMGGLDHCSAEDHPTKVVYKVNLTDLIDKASTDYKQTTPTLWQTIQDSLMQHSTPLFVGEHLYAIGGRTDISQRLTSSAIYCYQPKDKEWVQVGKLSTDRCLCACAKLPSGEVIVAGGDAEAYKYLDSVEILSFNTN